MVYFKIHLLFKDSFVIRHFLVLADYAFLVFYVWLLRWEKPKEHNAGWVFSFQKTSVYTHL